MRPTNAPVNMRTTRTVDQVSRNRLAVGEFKFVWFPKRSRSIRTDPGKVHVAYRRDKRGAWALICRYEMSDKFWDAARCRSEGGPQIPDTPTVTDWPTCSECHLEWFLIMQEAGHDISYEGAEWQRDWAFDWEEARGLRHKGARQDLIVHEAEMWERMRLAVNSLPTPDDLRSQSTVTKSGATGSHLRRPLFDPRSDAPYIAQVREATQTRSRDHERLIADFGKWTQDLGLEPNTNVYPCDLVVGAEPSDWLVEAKEVKGKPIHAVREALAQLLHYRWLYFTDSNPQLIALFSEPVGVENTNFLYTLDISSVWRDSNNWSGNIKYCEAP